MALGFATQFAGMAGWYWPMSVNRFFSAQVRVQQERGHHVIDVGPYAIVRHPGYASFFIMILGMPLALGSYVASIPASAIGLVFIRRVITEDRFLEANLPGYAEYAQRVRFRIVPGVW
jgi:protein-S-isoprenylcysteine O-methyltransferase Ste14